MKAAGIGGAIIPGVSPRHWSKLKAIAHQLQLPFTLGIHPWYCPKSIVESDLALTALKSELTSVNDPLMVGIGECGLDKPKAELAQDNPAHVPGTCNTGCWKGSCLGGGVEAAADTAFGEDP